MYRDDVHDNLATAKSLKIGERILHSYRAHGGMLVVVDLATEYEQT